MAHQSSVQGVMQVSLLGQFPAGLLDQVLARLASYAEHQHTLELEEDVFSRGLHDPATSFREEDILRIRRTTLDAVDEWTINAYSRSLPVRENPDVLMRGVTVTPVLEGDARSLAVALGYSERRFANLRKGTAFSVDGNLTVVHIFQIYPSVTATEPLDSHHYMVEVTSFTAHKPFATSATSPPMQALREKAISRTLGIKRLLKGLVDLARVE